MNAVDCIRLYAYIKVKRLQMLYMQVDSTKPKVSANYFKNIKII